MHLVLTYVSGPAARRLAQGLVQARLAACASYWPIRSIYRWKGRVQTSSEYALQAKTARPAAAMAWLKKNHPYELPVILSLQPKAVSPAAISWAKQVSQ